MHADGSLVGVDPLPDLSVRCVWDRNCGLRPLHCCFNCVLAYSCIDPSDNLDSRTVFVLLETEDALVAANAQIRCGPPYLLEAGGEVRGPK